MSVGRFLGHFKCPLRAVSALFFVFFISGTEQVPWDRARDLRKKFPYILKIWKLMIPFIKEEQRKEKKWQ